MHNIGVFFGKMIPATRGHLNAIINASTLCDKLYVIVSDNKNSTQTLCNKSNLKNMPLELRIQWLSEELYDLPNIKVIGLDETNIPVYPNGWKEWTDLLKTTVPENIDAFFCGEKIYADKLPLYFNNSEVILYDPERTFYNISATEIRQNPLKHWDYILGPARPFFAKKILISGIEDTGKTTLVKNLAKIYHTSWTEEVMNGYVAECLTKSNFNRILRLQEEQEFKALRNANKLCFFDTDATLMQFKSEIYRQEINDLIENHIYPNNYDIVILLKPFSKDKEDSIQKEGLHRHLLNMYRKRGFTNIYELDGTYNQKLGECLNLINNLI